MQRLAGRGDDADAGRGAQQRVGQLGACAHQVLAVVDDEERLVASDVRAQRLQQRLARLLLDVEDLRGDARDQRRVLDRCQVDEPHAVGELFEHVGGDLQRQARLAVTAEAEQRQQPRFAQQALRVGELALAADERRDLLRKIVGRRFERTQRGERVAQLRVDELVERFRGAEVAQADRTQVAQREIRRQPVGHVVVQCLRNQHLSAVRCALDAGGTVHGGAEHVAIAAFDHADVHAAAHAQREAVRRRGIGERRLHRHCGPQRVDGVRKDGVHSVADHLDDGAAIVLHGGPRDRVVNGERTRHRRPVLFPHPRAALDVGEHDGGNTVRFQVRYPRSSPVPRRHSTPWQGAPTRGVDVALLSRTAFLVTIALCSGRYGPANMIELEIPGCRALRLSDAVFDYNGTLARDGVLLDGVGPGMTRLADLLRVHVVTADTFGSASAQMRGLPCELTVLPAEGQAEAKADVVARLGAHQVVAVGNGRNDRLMLAAAELAIGVLGDEGIAIETLQASDVIVRNIADAFGLLLNPRRLTASLRT